MRSAHLTIMLLILILAVPTNAAPDNPAQVISWTSYDVYHDKVVLASTPVGLTPENPDFDLWEYTDSGLIKVFDNAHDGYISDTIWINDSSVATASLDGTVKIWERSLNGYILKNTMQTGIVSSLERHGQNEVVYETKIGQARAGDIIVQRTTSSDNSIQLQLPAVGRFTSIAWDGADKIAYSSNNSVFVYDETEESTTEHEFESLVLDLEWNHAADKLAVTFDPDANGDTNPKIITDTETLVLEWDMWIGYSVHWSPTDEYLLTSDFPHTTIWDVTSLTSLNSFNHPSAEAFWREDGGILLIEREGDVSLKSSAEVIPTPTSDNLAIPLFSIITTFAILKIVKKFE